MNDYLCERISDNPEITDILGNDGRGNFCAALGWGTAAGTATILVAVVAVSPLPHVISGYFAMLLVIVSLVAGVLTLVGMLVVGLPLTLSLRAFGAEYVGFYAALGAGAGFVMMALLSGRPGLHDPASIVVACAGGLAGLACSYRWGRWRSELARAPRHLLETSSPDKRTNPIHDLLH